MKFSNHLPVSTRSFLRTTRLRKIDAVFLCGLLAVTFIFQLAAFWPSTLEVPWQDEVAVWQSF